jgi:hypothetical protein
MLSGFAVMVNTPLLTDRFAAWFHSSCWLPGLPWPPSDSAIDVADHLVQSMDDAVNSSRNFKVQLPPGPLGIGVELVGVALADAVGVGVELLGAEAVGVELADAVGVGSGLAVGLGAADAGWTVKVR